MTIPSIIDRDALDRLVEWGGDKLLREMARLFLDNSIERLAQIEAGLAPGGDLEEVHRGAHSLKSSAANLGAMRVSEIAALLEATARDGDRDASQTHADALARAHEAADAELRRLLDEAAP